MDWPWPEYELLLVLAFFRSSRSFGSKTGFEWFKKNPSKRLHLSDNVKKFISGFLWLWDVLIG
jgi:hypothetical protein